MTGGQQCSSNASRSLDYLLLSPIGNGNPMDEVLTPMVTTTQTNANSVSCFVTAVTAGGAQEGNFETSSNPTTGTSQFIPGSGGVVVDSGAYIFVLCTATHVGDVINSITY
jgi:hypothetical protein